MEGWSRPSKKLALSASHIFSMVEKDAINFCSHSAAAAEFAGFPSLGATTVVFMYPAALIPNSNRALINVQNSLVFFVLINM